MPKPRALFLLSPDCLPQIYSSQTINQLQELTSTNGQVTEVEAILHRPENYADVEIVFSGWGAPRFDHTLLDALPHLKAVFYGAGSVRYFTTDSFWQRDILLTSAYLENAIPVAEFTIAAIVLSLKKAWTLSRSLAQGAQLDKYTLIPGVYHDAKVGVISLGAIGCSVCERLKAFDVEVRAYDPYAPADAFEQLGAQRSDTLEELFESCSIVTLHTPLLPNTQGMITRKLLNRLPPDSAFINTARGGLVDEEALVEVLKKRSDLFAVIDVIADEEQFTTTPLATMENVFLTPHIAGAFGKERARLGVSVVEECKRYLSGRPPLTPITKASMEKLA